MTDVTSTIRAPRVSVPPRPPTGSPPPRRWPPCCAAPAPAAANDAGVRDYLDLASRHEARRGCTRSPSNSSAIGYYQMTLAALRDIGLKDDAGNWLDNEWGITTDEEFQCHRAGQRRGR